MTREQLQEFERKPCADRQFIYKYSKRFRTGQFANVSEYSGNSVQSSTVGEKDSETRSKGQTSEDVEEEGGPAPSKRLIQ